MANEDKKEINENINSSNNNIRENLVDVAVKFLQNPKVEQTTLEQRTKFLRTKGLTDIEIDEAIKRSRPFFNNKNRVLPNLPPPIPAQTQFITKPTLFAQIKDGLLSIALLSGLLYSAFLFYKRYIYPILFGTKDKPKKNIKDEILEEVNVTILRTSDEIRQTIVQLQQDVTNVNDKQNVATHLSRQLDEIKSDIASVRSLLLNKKQFPTVSNSPVVPPSIPAWQLSNAQAQDVSDEPMTEHDTKSEELIERGSAGSGSSETEIVTKNSDSSIEIM